MTNQPDSMEETKTSDPIQQGELRLSASALRSPVEVFQVHGERRRLTEEEAREVLLECIHEAEQLLADNADLYRPSSAGGSQQLSE
jgi:hypothetical protein